MRELRKSVSLVQAQEVRQKFTFILRGLAYTSAISSFGNTSEVSAGHVLCSYGADVLVASIHGNRIPEEPPEFDQYRHAMSDADAVWEEVNLESERESE